MNKTSVRIVITLIAMLSIASIQAQTYRIEAGYLQPTRHSDQLSHRYLHGVRLGGTVDFTLPKADFLGIHTGLLYTFAFGNDSQKYHFDATSDSIRIGTQGHYLDIPIHITVSYTLFKNKVKAFAFAGPNFNIGLYQRQDVQTKIGNNDSTEGSLGRDWIENTLGYKIGVRNLYPDRLSPFNFQLEVGGGLQWWKLQVKAGYSFGLNNISKLDISRERQSGWWVSTAYEF